MSYNNEELPRYVKTAGKITVITAVTGLLVFIIAFMFDAGTKEIKRVTAAGGATTTLSVLNTPPFFTLNPYEVIGSSTSTPTNSGDVLQWSAIAEDPNLADYYLLVCSTNATPTPQASAAPTCGTGAIQWGVSTNTTSGTLATVSTTTAEWGTGQFSEVNNWYAWVCDGDTADPRCIIIPEQGDYPTSTSPFNINNRPVLTDFYNDGPADPNAAFNFLSTSTDPDLAGGEDNIYLVVCSTDTDYNAITNTCPNDLIASSTGGVLSDATVSYTLPPIIRDNTYAAYGYIVDEHGHEAINNGFNFDFVVNNVAPVVPSGSIELYGDLGPGSDLRVTVPNGETTGSVLNFRITDANSCMNSASGDEIVGFNASIFRSGIGSSTCDGSGTNYNPNNCYDSGVATTTWNLSCTATSTCSGPTQDYVDYTCTFPLWFVADPTDNGAETPPSLEIQNWSAAVSGIDDNGLTGLFATTSNPKELLSFGALDILSADIAYGGVEPGTDTGSLIATSTLVNVGNTGLDQLVKGESMCGTYTISTECPVSATSTIPENQQKFASTSISYLSPFAQSLSSTTDTEIELDVMKSIATSTPQTADTYWGIAVPVSITLSGNYTGLNTFTARIAEAADWY